MELTFTKNGNRYEAEFEATGNFNLHIERKKAGGVAIYQKPSAEGKYATDSSWSDNAPAVVDMDISMLIYPKMIKVVSRAEVACASVTMAGENSASGGDGFRPLTADDVTIYYGSMYSEMMPTTLIEWADTLDLEGEMGYWFVLNNQDAVVYCPYNGEFADSTVVKWAARVNENNDKCLFISSDWAGTAHIYPSKFYIKD